MPSVTFIDGVETPRERAVVSAFDRGFLYGDTVFETLRAYGGVPHLLDDHLARLRASAEAVGIALGADEPALAHEIRAAVSASGEPDAVVRMMASRGEGPLGIDPRSASRPRRIVHVEPLSARLGAVSGPVSLRLVATRRGVDLALHAKIGAYVDAILALRVAHASGDDDALLVDARGHVLEATTSNVFVVTGEGVVVTPPSGVVFAGLTRREVLRLARANGLSPVEAPVGADDVRRAREVFLTSSVREIVPVGRVDGVPLGPGEAPGPVTALLQASYRASIAGP